MGLHTGEAQVASADTGADYVGFEVHRAARVAAAPHGGQTVLSETTSALVANDLPPGVTVRDMGRHRLKDLRTDENAAAVAEICRRLDGLPLAIELAAARIRVLSPKATLPRLERRLALLADGARDLPARQRTLRGAIAWSYDMLDADARTLFETFSAFSGGAALAQAEAVCAGPGREDEVFDGLARLASASLVRQRELDAEPRFGMFETIREFAEERLRQSGRHDAARRRHAETFLDLAERAAAEVHGPARGRSSTRSSASTTTCARRSPGRSRPPRPRPRCG